LQKSGKGRTKTTISSNQAKATSIVMVRRSMIEIASTRFAHIATNVERLDDVRYAPLRQPA